MSLKGCELECEIYPAFLLTILHSVMHLRCSLPSTAPLDGLKRQIRPANWRKPSRGDPLRSLNVDCQLAERRPPQSAQG